MRVTTRAIYQEIQQRILQLSSNLKMINEKISSGKKINRPSDDPIGLIGSLSLKTALSQIGQYQRNIEHGEAWLNITESTLQTVDESVLRAREIANQMATGTYNEAQRKNAAQEVENIIEQLVQLSNTTLSGRYIFSGYKEDTAAFAQDLFIHSVLPDSSTYTGTATSSGSFTDLYSRQYVVEVTTGGAVGMAKYRVSEDGGTTWGPDDAFTTSTTPTPVYGSTDRGVRIAFSDSGTLTAGDRFTIEVSRYNGDQHDTEIAIGKSVQMKINLVGSAVFGEAGETESNIFDILVGLKNSLENNDIEGIQSRLAQIGGFESKLTGNIADVGSRLSRMEACKNMLSDLNLNYTTRLSEIEDADVIQATIDLNATETTYQAALYVAAQISKLNLIDFL